MDDKIKFEKTIIVKDLNGITRQAFLEGGSYDSYHVKTVLKNETIMNPDDLPKEFQISETEKDSQVENKMLPEDSQEVKKELEATSESVEQDEVVTENKPKATHKHKTSKGK